MNKESKDLNLKELEKKLKNKKIMFCFWDCENKDGDGYQNWCLPIGKSFKKTIFFDLKKKRLDYGPKNIKELLFKKIIQEKPSFIILTFSSQQLSHKIFLIFLYSCSI